MGNVVSESLIAGQPEVFEEPTVIEVSPPLTVKLTRRKTNTSAQILVTVNANTVIKVNGVEIP